MTILGKDRIRDILRILQYAPVAIIFFFAVSLWRDGYTEGAYILGLTGLGLLLLNGLLHISCFRDVTVAYKKHIGLVASFIITSIGVHSLLMADIYAGIFYVLLGMTFLFMEVLKGKWGIICCIVVLVFAVGILIWEEINDNRPYAIEREVGVQQGAKSKRHLYTGDPHASNNTILFLYG